ncbi:MAG: peroxiredoxin family protein [Candidatus Aminicenantales bacterium]
MRKLARTVVISIFLLIANLFLLTGQPSQPRPYVFSLEEAALNPALPVLLVFFNVSCHVCWDELFTWRDFIQTRGIKVELVGVTREPEEAVAAFMRKYFVSIPVVIDRRGHLFRKHQVRLEPFCLLVKKEKIIYKDNLMEPLARRREKLERCLRRLN